MKLILKKQTIVNLKFYWLPYTQKNSDDCRSVRCGSNACTDLEFCDTGNDCEGDTANYGNN